MICDDVPTGVMDRRATDKIIGQTDSRVELQVNRSELAEVYETAVLRLDMLTPQQRTTVKGFEKRPHPFCSSVRTNSLAQPPVHNLPCITSRA